MRLLTRIVAVGLLSTLVLVAIVGMMASWSPSGWFALGTAAVGALALFIRERRARRGLALVAGVLLAILLVVRIYGAGDGMIRMLTLPDGTSSRWLGRIVDEQDVALAGARVLAVRWPLPTDEREKLVPAMRDAYAEMRRDDAFTPSPALDTIFGRQTADAFDTLVIEPRAETSSAAPAKAGVIFLHGYAGSYTLECWLVARAARAIGAATVCPATGFSGHWRGESGARTLGASLDYLHARGIRRVFLAGLSNGAVGASALAPQFAPSLAGLILISGAPASGDSGGLPALVVHGSDDTMTSAASARAFAARTHATYAGFGGGHFVLLVRRSETREAIASWLRAQSVARGSGQHP
jgi:pimeloyl-ACP methyl ester carboxylesterase